MKLTIPPIETAGTDLYIELCWHHLKNSAEYAGVEVTIDPKLQKAADNAIEMLVDGEIAVYDYSDYLNLALNSGAYKHWFRFHYVEGYYGTKNLHSFPPISFLDWKHYYWLEKTVKVGIGQNIWFKQAIFEGGGTLVDKDRCDRRREMASKLRGLDIPNLDTTIWGQNEYWDRVPECGLSIHVPGSWRHSLDRGQLQMMGLGVCTVSPDIWTACCGLRPQAGEHYIMLDDRFVNLEHCLGLPLLTRWAIGTAAKRWFQDHCTPKAIWSYVGRMMNNV